MALHKTEGIVLRRQEVRETSLILIAFTRDLGKVQGLVKGVRGARAAVPWYLEPLTLQAMVLYERRRSPWSLVSQIDLIDAFDPIRRDFVRTCYASYGLDLVDAMTEPGDPHPEVFDLLLATLREMAVAQDPRPLARFLEAHLLKIGGLLPDPESIPLSPGARISLRQILQTPFDQAGRLRLSHAVEGELRGTFQRLIRVALDRPLKSQTFLQSLGLEGSEREASVRPEPVEGRTTATVHGSAGSP